MNAVTLSLVSHTNVGKTTLARTLLRRDVGEVFDQAHVTEVNEAYPLLVTADAELLLWDTPGLGDTVRLLRRLKQAENPVGWFLHQVWDRIRDRPLWCSQEALRNVRDDADVVLYLVNAAESPEDAGYVPLELQILSWIARPTLVVLNQTGGADASAAVVEEWREHLLHHPIVQDVVVLDAFARSWLQEDRLFERIVPLLGGEKQAAMQKLAAAWSARNRGIFERVTRRIAEHLATIAADTEPLPGRLASREKKRAAMQALATRLDQAEACLWDALVLEHGLEGSLAEEVRRDVHDYVLPGRADVLDAKKGAVVGGLVSGALGGLGADFLSGGLSLGGGLIAGAILGAMGGAGLGRAVQWAQSRDEPAVTWSPEFLGLFLCQACLRYLTLAHTGRGRGRVRAGADTERWRAALERMLAPKERELARVWKELAGKGGPPAGRSVDELERILSASLESILLEESAA